MIRVRFPSWEAVEAVLRTGRLSPALVMAPVAIGSDDEGVWLETSIRGADGEVLREQGATFVGAAGGRPVSCWAEAIPSASIPIGTFGRVLFELPVAEMLALAGELLRLGCDRQSWCRTGDIGWIEAEEPPWYSVLSALDTEGRAAYAPVKSGVWMELGREHPLAATMRPPAEHRLLIAQRWKVVRLASWTPLYERLDLHLPDRVLRVADEEVPPLPVRLRLVDSGITTAPSLWVLRSEGRSQIESLLGHLPDAVVERLLFAVAGELVLLRARPSVQGPPVLDLRAESYTPLLDLPNLFRPVEATLEPPLRRDCVQEIVGVAPFEIAWLARSKTGFKVERIEESAFSPLLDWVDYVVARDEDALGGWLKAASFQFERWVDEGLEWGRPVKRERSTPTVDVEIPVSSDNDEGMPERPAPVQRLRPLPAAPVPMVEEEGLAAELIEVEQAFRDVKGGFDAPARLELWRQMASLHRRLGNGREATLCWAHAVWEDPELLRPWAEEELGAVGLEPGPLRLAVLEDPRPELLRAVGAVLAAGQLEGDAELSPLFARNSELLDVRTAWLARCAITGGDVLARARARDDVLARFRRGLSLDRDVPAFIRSLDADATLGLAEHLEGQLEFFRTTKRKRSVIEADEALTFAYVELVFAWGFASLGERDRALELMGAAQRLDREAPVHDALVTAYEARIQQALAGVPRETPLPAVASSMINGLSSFHRFQVDRLRAASGILETAENLQPFVTFDRNYEDARGPEFTALREESSPEVLRPVLTKIVERAGEGEERARLLDGVFDFLPLLPAVDALPLLDRMVELLVDLEGPVRVRLLTDALMVVGLLGRVDRARELLADIRTALQELDAEELGTVAEVLAGGLRSLRRVGLRDGALALLDSVRDLLRVEDAGEVLREDPSARLIRAALVGGRLALGAMDAVEELDHLLDGLNEKMRVPQRLKLTRALGLALASAPPEVSLERLPLLSARLGEITDVFSTNSHFCLSVVSYAESVVLGYCDTELGGAARDWIDASEFRVRTRIYREEG